MSDYDSGDLDLLLSDVRRLLADDAEQQATGAAPMENPHPRAQAHPAQAHSAVSDETRMYRPVHDQRRPADAQPQQSQEQTVQRQSYGQTQQARQPSYGENHQPWEDPGYTGTYYGPNQAAPVVRSAAVHTSAPGRQRAAQQTHSAQPARPAQQARSTQPSRSGQQTRREAITEAEEAQLRQAQRRAERRRAPTRAQRAAHEILEDDEEEEEEELTPRKSHKGRKIVAVLVILGLVLFGVYTFFARQPKAETGTLGARKPGVSTILLAGTDKDGTRTDTIMLLSIDSKQHTASLVSVPRDTLVNGSYTLPKINGCYGWVGGGTDGMEELMDRVSECIGFRPDGYLLVDLDSFVDLVDIMGGVDFNVPVDMYYNDPSQDLYINLAAGEQHLDGQQAMGLVRFRATYAMADLERVNVQRDFVKAAADQWIGVKTIFKIPQLLAWYGDNVVTDLKVSNLTWIATKLMSCKSENMQTETLPGTAGPTYYVLDPAAVAEVVNRTCNPYEQDVTTADLSIRTG